MNAITQSLFKPAIGMRFERNNVRFEICFIQAGVVRYAAIRGGKQHTFTIEQFIALQESRDISIVNPELHKDMSEAKTPSWATLTDEESRRSMRKIFYAESAINELKYPNSISALTKWLKTFAILNVDICPPNPRSLSRWVKKLIEGGPESLTATERNRGNRRFRFSARVDNLVNDGINEYLNAPEQRDSKDVLAYVVGELHEAQELDKHGSIHTIPSERTIRRRLSEIDPILLIRKKRGTLAAEQSAKAAGQAITSSRPMQIVQIDTHYLKLIAVDPDTHEILGKPFLACALDVRTRCVVGTYVSFMPPSATTTLGVLKDMLTRPNRGLPGGKPVHIIPDNGTEFKNSSAERLLSKLIIIMQPAEIQDPDDKAQIESFFRTLSVFVVQKCPGTTFSNLEKRKGYKSEKYASVSLEQIKHYINMWINDEYHIRIHSQTKRSPISHWEDETALSKPISLSDTEVNAIARKVIRATIIKGRVRVHGLDYYSHALRTIEHEHSEKVTILVDELNLSQVFVENPFEQGRLIEADSTVPDYTHNLTLWEHIEAQKELAKLTKRDIERHGKFAPLLARRRLLERIQNDIKAFKKTVRLITQGKGRVTATNAFLESTLDLHHADRELIADNPAPSPSENPIERRPDLRPQLPDSFDSIDLG